jgi:replication factor C small subunit
MGEKRRKMWVEKYKPRNFDEVVGYAALKAALKAYAVERDMPHLLFYGKSGTGKTLTAELMAKELLGEYCEGNYIYLNASDDRSVSKIREQVITAIKHSTINGYLRIILLDEADGLLSDAQDVLRGAMNKCGKTRFLFTCNNITEIKAAIQDRCMMFAFKGLDKSDIIKRMEHIRASERLNIPDSIIDRIARESNGSMRKAIIELEKMSKGAGSNDELLRKYIDKEKYRVE